MSHYKRSVQHIRAVLRSLPAEIQVVAAAKTRTPDEVRAAVEAGVFAVGHNYVQEAEKMAAAFSQEDAVPSTHMIGHVQRNKAARAVRLFDMIQTVDSLQLADRLSRECSAIGKTLPILVEVNSGREPRKSGIQLEEAEDFVRALSALPSLQVEGLMTMGPAVDTPDRLRPYFRETRRLLDALARQQIPRVHMSVLSMGMSASYAVALEEGATMIRLGTALFGPRP